MRVDNWPFTTVANKLQITMKTTAETDQDDDGGGCSSPTYSNTTDVDSDNLRSLSVELNGVTLYHYYSFFYDFFDALRYGRFMEKAYLDGGVRSVQFMYNESASEVLIESPHFWQYVGMF